VAVTKLDLSSGEQVQGTLPTGNGGTGSTSLNGAGIEQTANKGAASGYPALNSSGFVVPGQLGSGTASSSTFLRGDSSWATPAAPLASVSVTSSTSVTLSTSNQVYVSTATSAATWTLPAVSGNTGVSFDLYNRGSASVTVQRAGSDNLYNQGATATSMPMMAGASIRLVNDGTYWIAITVYQPIPVYDNSAISSLQSAVSSGTAKTMTQTVGGAGNAYGIVAVAALNTSSVTSSATPTITFGGVTLSSLGFIACDNAGSSGWLWVFGGQNIPAGSETVSVKFTQSGDSWSGYFVSFTYLNVYGVGSLQTNYGSSATMSINTTPGASFPTVVWAIMNQPGSSVMSSFSLNQRQEVASSAVVVGGDINVSSTNTVAASAALNAGGSWAAASLSLL
jgi:hypothetical protein